MILAYGCALIFEPLWAIFFYPFVVWVVVRWPIEAYKDDIKETIFPNIISFMGGYHYERELGSYVRGLGRSRILPKFDKESNEDHFLGNYKGVTVDFFETELEKRYRRWDRKTLYKTVFKGIVICLSMNTSFRGTTILKKDHGTIRNFLTKTPKELDRVQLEDPDFEKMFEVFSNDQTEARYLLTPVFNESLMKLVALFKAKGVECSFFDRQFMMMIPASKNMFEPGSIFKSEGFIDNCKSLLAEINLIHQTIDTLKLDYDMAA